MPAPATLRLWLMALLIFAATDPVFPLLARGADDWAADFDAANAARKPGWAAIYLISFIFLILWRREAWRVLHRCALLPAALGWYGLSCAWAPSATDALFGFAQFALLLLFAGAAAERLGPEAVVRAVARAGLLALFASLAMVALSPQHAFGQQVNTGALRGVYGEKNHLATMLSLAFAAALFELAGRPARLRLWAAAGALLAGILAARSSIALGQAALAMGLAAGWAGLAGARYGAAALAAATAAGVASLLALAPQALSALGEDPTLNGRTDLWAALWPHAGARPLVGHGFGGFWDEGSADALRQSLGWNARGPHNGWLAALLAGGVVGAALWAAHWAQIAGRAAAALAPPLRRGPGWRPAEAEAWRQDAGRAGLAALTAAHLVWSLFESNQLVQMNVHALIAGLCLGLPSAGAAGRRTEARRARQASLSARSRNSGLPTA